MQRCRVGVTDVRGKSTFKSSAAAAAAVGVQQNVENGAGDVFRFSPKCF